jgi:hypothetical protein
VVFSIADLHELGEVPPEVDTLRCHFHVPLFQPADGPLGTTAGEIRAPLSFILEKDLTRHVILETYTWAILKEDLARGGQGIGSVHEGIARELRWCMDLLGMNPTEATQGHIQAVYGK